MDDRARRVLLRRSVADPAELTAYVCAAPDGAARGALVRVAGSRWTVESGFAAARQEVGLAEYAACRRTGWHRHVTSARLVPRSPTA